MTRTSSTPSWETADAMNTTSDQYDEDEPGYDNDTEHARRDE